MWRTLLLGFSHVREQKFRHDFKDTLNPLSSCSNEAETTAHYLSDSHFYIANRAIPMNNMENISISFSAVSDNNIIILFLFGDDKFDDTKNQKKLMSTIRFDKV